MTEKDRYQIAVMDILKQIDWLPVVGWFLLVLATEQIHPFVGALVASLGIIITQGVAIKRRS